MATVSVDEDASTITVDGTFASQLLTAGVSLGYVSAQLGHADVAVTARHYARSVADGDCVEAPRLDPNEIPADLLARLGGSIDPTATPHRNRAARSCRGSLSRR